MSTFEQTKGVCLLKVCRKYCNSLLVTNILPHFARKIAIRMSKDCKFFFL